MTAATLRRVSSGVLFALGFIHTSASLPAQSISFVASIKPNDAIDARSLSEYSPGGRFTAVAVTVGQLLRIAYRIQPYQLAGAPAWISTKRFDISAKVEDNSAPSQQIFLQTLLKERFKLAVHNETREYTIFALVPARMDGRLGPKLIKSTFDCAAYFAGPHDPPQPGQTPICGTRINVGALYGKAIPMTQLASSLAPFVERFTVDKTGLAGGYDVELTWTSDDSATGPSLFAALQEQLGLKLVSDKGQVPLLIVDRLEQPSAN